MTLREALPPKDLDEIVDLVDGEKLPPPPIDIKQHRSIIESNRVLLERFERMIDACFKYIKDVAHHEKLRRSGDDTTAADHTRSETHSQMIDAVLFYRNMAESIFPIEEIDLIPRNTDSRPRFGKFALLITLNRFKEQILLIKKFRKAGGRIRLRKIEVVHPK